MGITLPNGRFIKVNTALCDMLGYPENALLERRLESIIAPDQRGQLSEVSRDILAGKQSNAQIPFEYMPRRRKDRPGDVEFFHGRR
jgi:PAS domain S-box-containing protein